MSTLSYGAALSQPSTMTLTMDDESSSSSSSSSEDERKKKKRKKKKEDSDEKTEVRPTAPPATLSSDARMAFASALSKGGTASCSWRSSSAYASGMRSVRIESAWPSLMLPHTRDRTRGG